MHTEDLNIMRNDLSKLTQKNDRQI